MQKQLSLGWLIPGIFLRIAVLKNYKITLENISGGGLQVLRKALISINNKFAFLVNTNERENMLISCLNWLAFDIFTT